MSCVEVGGGCTQRVVLASIPTLFTWNLKKKMKNDITSPFHLACRKWFLYKQTNSRHSVYGKNLSI